MLLASAASSASETILAPVSDGMIFDQAPFNGVGDAGGIENHQSLALD
jgi:hypothetical protein